MTPQPELFRQPMYMVRVTGWPEDRLTPEKPVDAPPDARLAVWATDPADGRQVTPPGRPGCSSRPTGSRWSTAATGPCTRRSGPGRWTLDPAATTTGVGMAGLNLKSMYNDPSQMREALAWRLFRLAGVPAARHTYAKLAINGGTRACTR